MEFLNAMRFTGGKKPNQDGLTEDIVQFLQAEAKDDTLDQSVKSSEVNTTNSDAEDDDDFIMDEVKRRLKELKRKSRMELIPEEQSCPEDGDDGEASSFYSRYRERMLLFDGLITQQLQEIASHNPLVPSPKSASKKLASSFRCLSMKKQKEPEDELGLLQQPQCDPYSELDSAYVSHLCLTWEALHCQYTQLNQEISCGHHNPASYNHCAQQFQQFEVLLQRFIENEPFEHGSRSETYCRMRHSLPKLLQVPKVQGSEQKVMSGETLDSQVLATNILSSLGSSILTFYQFLRIEKKKSVVSVHGQMAPHFQRVLTSLEKKIQKLKEMKKKRKNWKKNTWPVIQEDVELLLSIIDMKVLSRAMNMGRISTEQLVWCEEKIKKIDFSNGKLQRDPSPLLFPC